MKPAVLFIERYILFSKLLQVYLTMKFNHLISILALLLEEIILVDDKSVIAERPELGKELDDYIKDNFLGYVKIIRQPERHGLIKGTCRFSVEK